MLRSLLRWLGLSKDRPGHPILDGEPRVCDCICHRTEQPGEIMHAYPCCKPCTHCNVPYCMGLTAHEAECASRPDGA